jgi:hypothetical protein
MEAQRKEMQTMVETIEQHTDAPDHAKVSDLLEPEDDVLVEKE